MKLLFKFKLFLKRYMNIHIIKIFPKFSTKFIKREFGNKELVGAEIGVLEGENAESILKTLSMKKLYLIDPYQEYSEYDFKFQMEDDLTINKTFKMMSLNIIENRAKKRLRKYQDKVIFIKHKSSDALDKIPDNLDFVYIDGNHIYKYVKQDIENYYKKIRVGGVLCGHDVSDPNVLKALLKFVVEHDLKLHIDFQDWVVVKK